MKYTESFEPAPPSAVAARRFVRGSLAEHGVPPEDSELIVSELLANVVQHAHTPITVKLEVGQTVRIEVHDGNSIVPAIKDAAEDAESGRGLFIISTLASQWGIDTTANGKCVWVEITREAT